ncbi:MAG: RES family NAD+ phosphorylase [Thermoanaerobaculia bacterium]
MPTAWRVVREAWKESAFDGEGARLAPGRWNGRGVAMIYTAQSRSLASLEALLNFEGSERRHLPTCVLYEVHFADHLVEILDARCLPRDWDSFPAPSSTRALGDRWVAEARSVVLRVPTVVTHGEHNFLLNPLHPDFGRIEIRPAEPFRWDPRVTL